MDSMLLHDAWLRYRDCHLLADSTAVQYRLAIQQWDAYFGSRSMEEVADTDLGAFSRHLAANHSIPTVNKIRRHLRAVWKFAGVPMPAWPRLREPKKAPLAFTTGEFRLGLELASTWPGWISGVPAGDWWRSLLLATWYSGARVGALLAVVPSDILWDENGFFARAAYQKQDADQFFVVGEDCLDSLRRIQKPERALVWPWPYRREALYRHFRRIFKLAGVPLEAGTGSLFHRIRRSTASYMTAGGGNATKQLGHSCSSVTERYLDPRICGACNATSFMPKL